MQKKLLLPVVVLLSVMLLSPALASASSTETVHFNGKAAVAATIFIEDSTQYLVLIAVGEGMANLPGPGGPMKGMGIICLVFDLSTSPPTLVFVDAKELTPSEFKWSFGACRVSTEMPLIGPLVVEWETVPPTETGHLNEKFEFGPYSVHVILNGAARMGSATVTAMGESTGGWLGLVARGVGTVVVKAP